MKKRPVDFVALRRLNVPVEEIERRQPVVGRYASGNPSGYPASSAATRHTLLATATEGLSASALRPAGYHPKPLRG
jgi:hypothetical protein